MNTVRMKINFNMSPKAAKRPVWNDSVETQWHKCAELQVKTSRIQTWPSQCAVFLGKTLYSHSATVGSGECQGRLGRGVGEGGGSDTPGHFIPSLYKQFYICGFWSYLLCSRLSWSDPESGKGFSLEYPSISLHAICRDTSQFPHECIYCMMDSPLDGMCRLTEEKNIASPY